jgi:hypothetical protein
MPLCGADKLAVTAEVALSVIELVEVVPVPIEARSALCFSCSGLRRALTATQTAKNIVELTRAEPVLLVVARWCNKLQAQRTDIVS